MVYTCLYMLLPPIYGKHIWMVYDCGSPTQLARGTLPIERWTVPKKVGRWWCWNWVTGSKLPLVSMMWIPLNRSLHTQFRHRNSWDARGSNPLYPPQETLVITGSVLFVGLDGHGMITVGPENLIVSFHRGHFPSSSCYLVLKSADAKASTQCCENHVNSYAQLEGTVPESPNLVRFALLCIGIT